MPLFPRKLAADERVSREVVNQLIEALTELRSSRTGVGAEQFASGSTEDGARPLVRAASPLCARHRPFGLAIGTQQAEFEELVELVTDLHIGGSATAKVLTFDGLTWTEADTEELNVHDAIGTFEGVAGGRALVRFHRRSGQWIVWQLHC